MKELLCIGHLSDNIMEEDYKCPKYKEICCHDCESVDSCKHKCLDDNRYCSSYNEVIK